jgi:hypothetical protein
MTARTRRSPAKGAGTFTVVRTERIGPTYAKGLHHLAGIGMGVRQGEPFDGMRLDFELSCGTAALRVDGRDFGISLLNCHVGLDRRNCDVKAYSRYEHRLVKGSFEASGTETQSSDRHLAMSIEAEAGLSANPVLAPTGALGRFKGRFGWGKGKKEQRQETVRRQPRVDLVATFGHDRWRVGDARLGDARRSDGKLAGTYFVEEQDGDGEPKPLCVVGRVDASTDVQVTISVSAPLTQVFVEAAGQQVSVEERAGVEESLQQRSTRAQKRHATAQADLRGRIAGFALGKALADAQREAGFPVPDGEFLIARQTLCMPTSVVASSAAREEEA